jgi:hypothetical protein
MSFRSVVRFPLALAGVSLFAASLGAGPATAAVVELERFGGSGSEIVEECGYANLVWSYDYNGSLRVVQRGPNGPEVFSLNVRFRNTWTDDAGATLTAQGTLLDKDLEVIDNGDGTTTLIVLLTGGFHFRGSRGVISADPGQLRLAVTFDVDGEVIDEQVVKGSTGRNDDTDLCDALDLTFGSG